MTERRQEKRSLKKPFPKEVRLFLFRKLRRKKGCPTLQSLAQGGNWYRSRRKNRGRRKESIRAAGNSPCRGDMQEVEIARPGRPHRISARESVWGN